MQSLHKYVGIILPFIVIIICFPVSTVYEFVVSYTHIKDDELMVYLINVFPAVLVGVLARMPSILLQLLGDLDIFCLNSINPWSPFLAFYLACYFKSSYLVNVNLFPLLLVIYVDVKVIYETKLVHVQYHELLSRICKVLESTSDANRVRDAGVYAAIMEAACNGNVEFIMNILKANPELVWNPYLARDMFMLAIEHRQAEVFSLLYGLPDKQEIASLKDANGNNMLHKAALVPSSRILNLIPGAALQMQRQLQWFKVTPSLSQLIPHFPIR